MEFPAVSHLVNATFSEFGSRRSHTEPAPQSPQPVADGHRSESGSSGGGTAPDSRSESGPGKHLNAEA